MDFARGFCLFSFSASEVLDRDFPWATACDGRRNTAQIALQRHVGRSAHDAGERKLAFSWIAIAPAAANFAGPLIAGLLIDHAGPHAPEVDSASMALELMGQLTPASHVFQRREMSQRMQEALEGLSATDREVLVLRHFEELTNSEVSQVLNIQAKAASIRYVRALARLKAVLERDPEFHEES